MVLINCASLNGTFGGHASSGIAPYGAWSGVANCETGTFITAFILQVEGPHTFDQKTSVDWCSPSALRMRKDWVDLGETTPPAEKTVTRFNRQIIDILIISGETMAVTMIPPQNWVKFHCRNPDHDPEYELIVQPGHGLFGTFGKYSESCPLKSAICGLQTWIEGAQGDGDDTGLNDAKFFCCSN